MAPGPLGDVVYLFTNVIAWLMKNADDLLCGLPGCKVVVDDGSELVKILFDT